MDLTICFVFKQSKRVFDIISCQFNHLCEHHWLQEEVSSEVRAVGTTHPGFLLILEVESGVRKKEGIFSI